jgi:SagB-type dehydrogenase family enzyme
MAKSGASLYELFWENSKLSPVTAPSFSARIASYSASGRRPPSFRFPSPDIVLERPTDFLASLMARRESARAFSRTAVTERQLGRVFGAFAASAHGSRTFPSAGATYAVEIFCLLNNVEGPLNGHAVYYNHDRHSVSVVGEVPSWEEYADTVNIETSGVPQLVFVFVVLPERTTQKYGERGGRFALLEVGHAAQNLALRLVAERMVGCAAGGLYDDVLLRMLGLGEVHAHVALGYVCGLAPHERRMLGRLIRTGTS